MIRIKDKIAGDRITFHYLRNKMDCEEFRWWLPLSKVRAIDTESTGINCYTPQWRLRTVQCGDAYDSYVIPARSRKLIAWLMQQEITWIGHNGPHDIRSIDQFLGYETGVVCKGETYIPSHHADSRNQQEGGVGHGLKELACTHVDRNAGKWEVALKQAFKEITIPMPGEVYKSGPRKGLQKVRKAKLAEGWGLIKHDDPRYIAYAGADPILTYRVWRKYQPTVRNFHDLYQTDHRVQLACDRLQRRAIKLDRHYTERLSAAFLSRARKMQDAARIYGCDNIQSGKQIADVLLALGVKLTEKTPTGQYVTDNRVLRALMAKAKADRKDDSSEGALYVEDFIRSVLIAKQLLKRRESYTEAMLHEMDIHGRVHPSINSLGARTTRMSVSKPALQQLPTKNRDDEE